MNKLTQWTPAIIANQSKEQQCSYSIPIYQRLFEWDEENIHTLLNDLYKSFSRSKEEDYYIGMLTSTADGELVDGQQRFTVMMLMGCVFQDYYEEWKRFLFVGDNSENVRLYFLSRPADNTYLKTLIYKEKRPNAINKMANGVAAIEGYLKENFSDENHLKKFAKYVYEHLCFFVTDLPEKYSPRDLNTYFERMNTTGRNLEQHEILKVKLLSNLKSSESYMSLWNTLADVDEPLVRDKNKKSSAFQDVGQLDKFINAIEDQEKEGKADLTIGQKPSSPDQPKKKVAIKDAHCALTFPYLLLQALYYFKKGNIEGNIEDFFNPSNLLDTFAKHLPYEGNDVSKDDIISFIQLLVRSKLALDICFVRPSEFGYSLDMDHDENNQEDLKILLMYESMLYVSSSNVTHYRWFGWLMETIEDAEHNIPDAKTLFEALKSKDEELKEHSLQALSEYDELSFGNIDRYWFWKLDFYIWQHRKELFKDSALKVTDNYVFRRNRSLEHIAPQTPKSNSELQWEDNNEEDTKLSNSFGNLVMISQGLNSALQNESYEVKRAHVESYINGSKSGSIESLKLLYAYVQYKTWNRETIKDHGPKMYEFLKKSFGS